MPGFLQWLDTSVGPIAVISSVFTFRDRLGSWKARWGIGRMSYNVPAGLYAIGAPTAESPVIVTANYKMTYDLVRRELEGRNIWLLVLETYGINVWCAAGKGTFGTGELVRRIESTGLAKVVGHRELILPILGAAGVSSPEVARQTGFTVKYATIRASDLPRFLDDMVTAPEMRELTFTTWERLVLVPVELREALKASWFILPVLFFFGGYSEGEFVLRDAFIPLIGYAGTLAAGVLAGPVLLPWLPGRSFAGKGALVGLVWGLIFFMMYGCAWSGYATAAVLIAIPALSSFLTLNFTGCTPFTSRSGVKKEMRLTLPIMLVMLVAGGLLWVAGKVS